MTTTWNGFIRGLVCRRLNVESRFAVQAIERNSRKFGIKHGEQGGCDVPKSLMATALLPHDRIPDALKVIEDTVESSTAAYRTKANRLLKYFKGEWMSKVTPQAFSVYGQKNRTNNCQETLNRNINRSIKPQGNTWDFWGGLLEISVKEINYFTQLSEGNECARLKKNKWLLLQDANIAKLQRKLINGDLSLAAFLTAASHRIATITGAGTPSAVDGGGEDAEDAELHGLDVTEGTDHENEERQPRRAGYVNYRWEATQLVQEDFMAIAVVCQQRLEIERGLTTSDERSEPASEGQAVCLGCTTNRATRVCSPCGHNVFCCECVWGFVRQEVFYSVTTADGDIFETQTRLPLTCPSCRAIIG